MVYVPGFEPIKTLGFYKLHPDVQLPKFATSGSACFDISCSLAGIVKVEQYSDNNVTWYEPILHDNEHADAFFWLRAGFRAMVPTNFILDIPRFHSVRLHARSGLSFKRGLVLANQEGVIDSDYVEPLFVLLWNTSTKDLNIIDGDRIAQAELVKNTPAVMGWINKRPERKTERAGGIGSTGVSHTEVQAFVEGYDK
jgi:deoxyuridine 5'-triphosphate nucleotidohydrolase